MEKLKGYVDRIIYSNAENGYTALNLIVDGDEVSCVGTFGKVDAGETLELEGDWTSHPMYVAELEEIVRKKGYIEEMRAASNDGIF